MATVTEIQAQLGAGGQDARIIRSIVIDGTYDSHYVTGLADATGRARWCQTTTAESAANQAAEILTALRA